MYDVLLLKPLYTQLLTVQLAGQHAPPSSSQRRRSAPSPSRLAPTCLVRTLPLAVSQRHTSEFWPWFPVASMLPEPCMRSNRWNRNLIACSSGSVECSAA